MLKNCKETGSPNNFVWLLYWFWSQVNDDWEHCYGISFKVNSECKWELEIDAAETVLVNLDPSKIVKKMLEDRFEITFSDDKFVGTADLLGLFELIERFRTIGEPYCETTHVVDKLELNDEPLMNLVSWYEREICTPCANINVNKFEITTLDNPGWSFKVVLKGTKFEKVFFPQKKDFRSDNNWIICKYENAEFFCACGPFNILEGMSFFMKCVNGKQLI